MLFSGIGSTFPPSTLTISVAQKPLPRMRNRRSSWESQESPRSTDSWGYKPSDAGACCLFCLELLFYVYMCGSEYVFVNHVCSGACRDQRRSLDLSELELWRKGNLPVGAQGARNANSGPTQEQWTLLTTARSTSSGPGTLVFNSMDFWPAAVLDS